jgi:hypothetical protein
MPEIVYPVMFYLGSVALASIGIVALFKCVAMPLLFRLARYIDARRRMEEDRLGAMSNQDIVEVLRSDSARNEIEMIAALNVASKRMSDLEVLAQVVRLKGSPSRLIRMRVASLLTEFEQPTL